VVDRNVASLSDVFERDRSADSSRSTGDGGGFAAEDIPSWKSSHYRREKI
jgi:hypothetical protein